MSDEDLDRIGADIVELAAWWPDDTTRAALAEVGTFARRLSRSAFPPPQDVPPSGD
ncbi:hypothetical protein ACFFSW_34770 [Saccharothrix longispora]|uniref:Uncharacterized protein n=1 Tax=Saccharothrix longispora TaxID=33920 RepID=A0ABU1PM58_9PSEU|nr:hypothetical protein [Saccharothrix longispora]MDR6591693.1 hypothetical protein [Saccharothrix longispora]MDU0293598.1 hypothetical protein [Saccharothrix longispora]